MNSGIRTFVCIVLLGGLVAAWYYFMFQPLSQEIAGIQEETKIKREKLETLRTAAAGVRDLPAEIDKLKQALSMFEAKLPDAQETDKVFGEVWQIAQKDGLNVKTVRPMEVINGNDYSEQPIKLTIVGQFGDPKHPERGGLYPFLKAVEEMNRVTRISEMTMSTEPRADAPLTAELTLSIFFGQRAKVASAQ